MFSNIRIWCDQPNNSTGGVASADGGATEADCHGGRGGAKGFFSGVGSNGDSQRNGARRRARPQSTPIGLRRWLRGRRGDQERLLHPQRIAIAAHV
jgi:hypothetical protein